MFTFPAHIKILFRAFLELQNVFFFQLIPNFTIHFLILEIIYFQLFNDFLTILLFISDSQISKYNFIKLFQSKSLPRCLTFYQSYKYLVLENISFFLINHNKSLFWYNTAVFTPIYHSMYNFKIFVMFYLDEAINISFS